MATRTRTAITPQVNVIGPTSVRSKALMQGLDDGWGERIGVHVMPAVTKPLVGTVGSMTLLAMQGTTFLLE